MDFEEPIKTNDQFYTRFQMLVKEYNGPNSSFDIQKLLSDIYLGLTCLIVALIGRDNKSDQPMMRCYPQNKRTLLFNILKEREGQEKIWEKASRYPFEGISIMVDIHDEKAKGLFGKIIDIDVIPLPHTRDEKKHGDSEYFMVLVNPILMAPLPIENDTRYVQRVILSHFLREWWRSAMTLHPIYQIKSGIFMASTIQELVSEGRRSAEHIRNCNKSSGIYFKNEEPDSFDWERWEPRSLYPFKELKDYKPKEKARLLLYFCRWIDSHHSLENEKRNSINPHFNEKDEKPERALRNSDNKIPVSEWIKKRREGFSEILTKLNELRKLTMEEYKKASSDKPLLVTSYLLIRFNLNNILTQDGHICSDLRSGAMSDIEFCRTLHGIAVVAHYAFEVQELSEDVIHRIIQLISRYGHEQLGIPKRLDLRAHLLQAARGEPALHALTKFYRNHFFHVLDVCFLGHLLLETRLENNTPIWRLVAENLELKEKNQVLRLWYIASLLHDIGYAMEVLNSSRNFLGFFKHSEALKSLDMSFEKAVRDLANSPEIETLGIPQTEGVEKDHGVVGALHISSLLENIAKDDPKVKVDEYTPMIHAVAMHNLRKHTDKISFRNQPIAFLLALCDQLQEWRRPRLAYSISPNLMLAQLGGALENQGASEEVFKSMSIDLEVSHDKLGNLTSVCKKGETGRRSIEFTLEYNEKIDRNSSVFSLWLDATSNFQRLNFEGLPLDITVKYLTPMYKGEPLGKPEPQLHRLRNAAHETHMSFLMDWFPTKESATKGVYTNGAVSYCEKDGKEELTLDLRALSSKVLMTKEMSAFWKCLQEWKLFNEDREFPGDYVSAIPE